MITIKVFENNTTLLDTYKVVKNDFTVETTGERLQFLDSQSQKEIRAHRFTDNKIAQAILTRLMEILYPEERIEITTSED